MEIEDYSCPGSDHRQEEWSLRHEIVFVRSGMFTRRDRSGTAVADSNHVLFFHKQHPYQVYHPVCSGDTCTVFALAEPLLMDILGVWNPDLLDKPDNPFPVGAAVIAPENKLRLYEVLRLSTGHDSLALEEHTLALLSVIVKDTLQRANALNVRESAGGDDIVSRVKIYLAANFREALSLDQIAQAVHTSPFWLCRVFKAHTRLTIHQYLHRIRLFHALEHLADTPQQPLSRLAVELGFYSHSHFTGAFTRQFNMPPKAFRQRMTSAHLREQRKILEV